MVVGLFVSPLVRAYDADMLDTINVHAKRIKQEQGYQTQRSSIAGMGMSLLDIPFSVDVVTQQQLEDKQPETLADAVAGISGVHQGNDLGGTLDAIVKRGYGGNRDHSIMRNGMEMTQARNFTATAERVEVLKGPASVLYGIQDPGGIINVVSKKPLYAAENSISLGFGNYAAKEIGIDSTGPIGNTGFAYRFIADYTGKNHWRDFGKYRQSIIAPSLMWRNETTEILAAYEYQNYSSPFDRGTFIDTSTGKPLNIPATRRLDEAFNVSDGYSHSFQLTAKHKLNSNWTLNAGYGYNLNHYNDWQARIMKYDPKKRTVTRRIDGTRPSDYEAHNFQLSANGLLDQNDWITHKLRIAVQAEDNDLRLGDMYRSKNQAGFSVDHPVYGGSKLLETSSVKPTQSDQKQRLQTAALLVQDAAYLGDNWIISGGLRGQYYKSESGKGRGIDYFRNESHGFKVLPQIGVVYKLAENWALYANYASSLNPNASRAKKISSSMPPEEG